MTTVLAVYNSEGCVGRCDARCHDATTSDCDCICGGACHGSAHAIQAATDYIDPDGELRRAFAAAHGLDASDLRVVPAQPELPLC
jgi:hypothetical protein